MAFVKHCRSEKRYNSEKKNSIVFRNLGFSVPKLVNSIDKERRAEYEIALGREIDLRDLDKVISALSKIYQKRHIILKNTDTSLTKSRYLALIKIIMIDIGMEEKYIQAISYILNEHWVTSVFKDAKPENWIITDSGQLIMLDFDYVVASAFFQDLAQFLTGILLNFRELSSTGMLDGYDAFVDRIDFDASAQKKVEIRNCFLVACLLSLSKKIEYGRYDTNIIKRISRRRIEIIELIRENTHGAIN